MSARSLPPIEIDSTAEGDRATVIPEEPVRPALFTVTDPSEAEDSTPLSRVPTVAPPNLDMLDDFDFLAIELPSEIPKIVGPEKATSKVDMAWLTTTAVSAGIEPSTQKPQNEEDAMAILGSFDAVPRHAVSPDQLVKLRLDHHAGFMLALVDGVLSIETIVDVCGMKKAEALRVLSFLVRKGVIEV